MRATGMVRRIDDLGRVVIPKEVRRQLGIQDGDPLELFIENGGVTFVKYDPQPDIEEQIKNILDNLSDTEYSGAMNERKRQLTTTMLSCLLSALKE